MNIPIMAIVPFTIIWWLLNSYRRWTNSRVFNVILLCLGILAVAVAFVGFIDLLDIQPNNRTFTGREQ